LTTCNDDDDDDFILRVGKDVAPPKVIKQLFCTVANHFILKVQATEYNEDQIPEWEDYVS